MECIEYVEQQSGGKYWDWFIFEGVQIVHVHLHSRDILMRHPLGVHSKEQSIRAKEKRLVILIEKISLYPINSTLPYVIL